MSPFLAWGDFHARARFACSTIPEERWGLFVVYTILSALCFGEFKLRVIVSRTPPIHPEGGRVGVVRATCVLYGVIVVKVDRGFLWEFRPNRFIKNNSQLKYSILISSCLFFLLVWSFSRSYAILPISGSPTSFQAVFIKNSCEYSRTPLTRTLKGNKNQLELSGSIAKLHFQYVLRTDSY